jgi:hypothetical protein
MGWAFLAALVLCAAALGVFGAGEKGTGWALTATARLSFLLFWPAYAGAAMAALFGTGFQPLKRHTRDFGLAFASAHLVHIGLVAWLCWIGAVPTLGTFVFFGIALLWTYLLALLSLGRLQQLLSPAVWWTTRTVGMNYIAGAFAVDFLHAPLYGGITRIVWYLPFAVLAVVGPLLRLAAFVQRLAPSLQAQAAALSMRSRSR